MSSEIPLSMVKINQAMVATEEDNLSVAADPLVLFNVPKYRTNRFTKSWEHDIRYVLGQADYYDVVRMRRQNNFTIAYDLAETTFIQYGIAPPAGTGTIAKTLTFILPMEINGIQKYRVFDGCITNTVNLEFRDFYNVEHSWTARNITKPLSEDELKLHLGLTTTADLNFPAEGNDPFWSNLEPIETTQKPLSINGTDYRTTGITISVERNPPPAHATSNDNYWHIESGYRGISGTVELYHIDDAIEDLLDDWTTINMVYTMNDSPSVSCTLTGVKFHTINEDLAAGESRYVMQSIPFTAKTIDMTAV